MDTAYYQFAIADRYFYELPENASNSGPSLGTYELDNTVSWSEWGSHGTPTWRYLVPKDSSMPKQGWKLHISVALDSAQSTLRKVSKYCNKHNVDFKFIPDERGLLLRNSKYADRTASGKFIVVYPQNDQQSIKMAIEINELLKNEEKGPYILSDVRWDDGPVYLRYGSFLPRYIESKNGQKVPAIEDQHGRLVPDVRDVRVVIPDWIEVPEEIQRQLDILNDKEPPADLKCSFDEALHFSNGGGVYKGRMLDTGTSVVIKEGRPKAGLTLDKKDAVERLKHEESILQLLSGIHGVPKLISSFELSGHHFMVQECMDGETLNSYITHNTPYIRGGERNPDAEKEYTRNILDIVAKIKNLLSEIHSRGVVFGDFHPNNVIVNDDNDVAIIDYEMAYSYNPSDSIREVRNTIAGAPGYIAPNGISNDDSDWFGLGCLMLNAFYPLSTLFTLDKGKVDHIGQYILSRHSYVPEEFINEAQKYIYQGFDKASDSLPLLCANVDNFISHASFSDKENFCELRELISRVPRRTADFSRSDRLFPADPKEFATKGVGYGYGASGVFDIFCDSLTEEDQRLSLQWIEDTVKSDKPGILPDDGLFDGTCGTAITLWRYGRTEISQIFLDELRQWDMSDMSDISLDTGLSGILLGIRWMRQYSDDPDLEKIYDSIVRRIAILATQEVESRERGGPEQTNPVGEGGLFRGLSAPGVALLMVAKDIGSKNLLSLSERLIASDLNMTVTMSDGSLQTAESNNRVLPYLHTGSGGLYIALRMLKNSIGSAFHFDEEMAKIEIALSAHFCIQAGYLNGRSGLLTILTCAPSSDYISSLIKDSTDILALHAVRYKDGIAFPGDQIMRLSTDFASGSAGVMHSLSAGRSYLDGHYIDQDNEKLLARIIPCLRPIGE